MRQHLDGDRQRPRLRPISRPEPNARQPLVSRFAEFFGDRPFSAWSTNNSLVNVEKCLTVFVLAQIFRAVRCHYVVLQHLVSSKSS